MRQRITMDKAAPYQGAMDFSHLLDAPAGKYGHVQIKDGHFYFENGKRIRFFGFNFPARANMPDHETAEALADRLATMGVNVVRVHAVDAWIGEKGWSTDPAYSVLNYRTGKNGLNEKGMERLDYWLYQLKIHGIYLHIDLLVGRKFEKTLCLDYPEDLMMSKSSSHFNERLIELQEQYARQYLTHRNPYTGLSLAEDPAVMTVQICNEDSVFFDSRNGREGAGVKAYKDELQRRFNCFLLARYGSREHLKKAWTYQAADGWKTDLREEEDPEKGTVRCPEVGNYCQNVNDPAYASVQETGLESPGRYADFTRFEIGLNREYYGRMVSLLRSIPVKAPIATGCLLAGAADIYSHLDADVMENNAYFNHPVGTNPNSGGVLVPDLRDYVSTDPFTETFPETEHRSNITVQASIAAIEKRPMILSEWNEYGLQLFHAPAYLMTTAYACLNDWDGLIIYCYHTDDHLRPEAADPILDLMDCYSDASLVLQFGLLANVFQKGMIAASPVSAHLVYRQEDLLRLPYTYRMPTSYLPLVLRMRSVFSGPGEGYDGDAQIAVSAGFVAGGDYTKAGHAILYRHSDELDAYGKHRMPEESCGKNSFMEYRRQGGRAELEDDRYHGEAFLNDRYLTIEDIDGLTEKNDYTLFARLTDLALKRWGLLSERAGLQPDGEIISQTGEIFFHPKEGYFRVDTPEFKAFAGRNSGEIRLSEELRIKGDNPSLFACAFSLDRKPLNCSGHYLILVFGESGREQTTYHTVNERITEVRRNGERFVEVLDGIVEIGGAREKAVYELSMTGQRQRLLTKTGVCGQEHFRMNTPAVEVAVAD